MLIVVNYLPIFLSILKNTAVLFLRLSMGRQGFAPQISILHSWSLQQLWWSKIIFFDCYEILALKADYRWHGSDQACKLDICSLILDLPLLSLSLFNV